MVVYVCGVCCIDFYVIEGDLFVYCEWVIFGYEVVGEVIEVGLVVGVVVGGEFD